VNAPPTSKPTALIVDDARTIRAILSDLMRSLGFEVLVASDGEEALALLDPPQSVQLALIDWEMPLMDGLTLARRIRRQARFAATRIIMVTAKTSQDDIREGIRCGVDEYIMKPFTRSILIDKLRIIDLWHDDPEANPTTDGTPDEHLISDTCPPPPDHIL
jgi:two-component system chemotaxis response regulator CheY